MNPWWLLLIVPGAMLAGGLIGLAIFAYNFAKNLRW